MPRKIRTEAEQKRIDHLIGRTKKAQSEYRKAKRDAMERARLAAEREINERRGAVAKLALESLEAGASLREVGRDALGTTDYATVRKLIGEVDLAAIRERSAAVSESAYPGIDVVRVGGSEYRIALSGPELDKATQRADWSSGAVPEDFRSAEARHEGGRFIPSTDGWIASLSEQHPVVAWIALPSSQTKLNEIVEAIA